MAKMKWGVIGLGRAGRARSRGILDDDRCELVCAYRGDPAALGVAAASSVDAMLDSVDAVAVCSPDHTHPRLVQRALEAGKHVVCEFPLAGSALKARRLFALADEVGRVLHVEHIELLTPAARWLRAHVRPEHVVGGAIRFQGRLRPEVFSMAHANLARLHRLIDVAGEPRRFEITDATLETLTGVFKITGGAHIDFSFHQGEGLASKMEFTLDLGRRGMVLVLGRTLMFKGVPVDLPSGQSLFTLDHYAAMGAILHQDPLYVERSRVLTVLGLADRLDAAARERGAYD